MAILISVAGKKADYARQLKHDSFVGRTQDSWKTIPNVEIHTLSEEKMAAICGGWEKGENVETRTAIIISR